MTFKVSPGVYVREVDLTTRVLPSSGVQGAFVYPANYFDIQFQYDWHDQAEDTPVGKTSWDTAEYMWGKDSVR